MKIGVIGAGFVGRAIAKLAIKEGHEVMLSNSRDVRTLFSLRPMIGCEIGTPVEAAQFGEVVVLAVPLSALESLPTKELAGKQVIDAVNYFPERDGRIVALDTSSTTSSEYIASFLPESFLTKGFNAIPMTDLESDGLPTGSENRRALPMAGDEAGKQLVASLYEAFGFDVVDVGPLSESWRFERGRPSYCVYKNKDELMVLLAQTQR